MLVKYISGGLAHITFPNICYICGTSLSEAEDTICIHCLKNRFELANPKYQKFSGAELVPDFVTLQTALWNFDKGGYLQDALHQLKYERLTGIGVDFGIALAWQLHQHPLIKQVEEDEVILVPVPLHYRKRRKRGYNQAWYISKGILSVTGWPIAPQEAVLRVKNTKTQTGFSLEERRKNISGAFLVKDKSWVKDKICMIVDDVFTTGATTFELAQTLSKAGARESMICTIAQA